MKLWTYYYGTDLDADYAMGRITKSAYRQALKRREAAFWRHCRKELKYEELLSPEQVEIFEAYGTRWAGPTVSYGSTYDNLRGLTQFFRELKKAKQQAAEAERPKRRGHK